MSDNLPILLDVDSWVAWFADHGEPTADELLTAMCRVGRIPAVALLADLHFEGLITRDVMTAMVGDTWSSAEYPNSDLEANTWRTMFTFAGYTVDGVAAERPPESLTLWRGSLPEHRTNWSWTDNREVAERYADGVHYRRPLSTVWRAVVEPWRLLARLDDRKEHEYVVDTDGLSITAGA